MQLTSDVRPFFTLSYHSYGEYLMYPYGCSDPDERSALDEIAQGLNSILENDSGVTGQYATGPIGSTIYLVDGGSVDTQYNQYGAYAYVIEVNNGAVSGGFQPEYATVARRHSTAAAYRVDLLPRQDARRRADPRDRHRRGNRAASPRQPQPARGDLHTR